jgi:hypothetical protein
VSRWRSWHDDAWCLRSRSTSRERQQGNVARPLDGHAQPALMPRANARHPPRQNLSALLHELRQDVRALIVNEVHLLDAELANFLLAEILAFAPGPSTWTPRSALTAARPAFTPRTTVATAMPAFTPRSSARR